MEMIRKFLSSAEYEPFRKLLYIVFVLTAALFCERLLRKINRRFFQKVQEQKKNLHMAFFEKFINIVIVIVVFILAVSAFSGKGSIWTTLLGGTSVIIAVVTFAAQDIIKDILAGLMISIYKPFDIGDRIELDNGVAGIVEDITMRHVVIITIDTLREVIPNSKINEMTLLNCSYHSDLRSVNMKFSVSYDSDIELVKRLIYVAVSDSSLTVPGRQGKNGEAEYGAVYFLSFADSALIMATTVYYKGCTTERIRDEINTRVNDSFKQHGVEIPYNYINVISKEEV